MPLLILGLVFFSLLWMTWALLWLFWPVTLLVAGALLWRGQRRRWERLNARGDHTPVTHPAAIAYSTAIVPRGCVNSTRSAAASANF